MSLRGSYPVKHSLSSGDYPFPNIRMHVEVTKLMQAGIQQPPHLFYSYFGQII